MDIIQKRIKENSMQKESCYLLKIIKYILNHQDGSIPLPDKEIDWGRMFELAKRHGVLNLVHYGVEKLPEEHRPNEDMCKILQKHAMKNVVVSVNQIEAEKEIMKAFENEGIYALAVKGICTKQYYPQPDMRSMGDIDILYQSSQDKKIKKVMVELEYGKSLEGRKHDSYFRAPYIGVEMHRELLAVDSKYHSYYNNIWNRVSVKHGCQYIHEMRIEDEYIYMMIHLVDHFINGGIGIRFVMDVYVYNRMEHIDWNYVESELQKLGLLTFYKKISALALQWFVMNCMENEEAEELEELATYIIANGVFGSSENGAAVSVSKSGRFVFLMKTLFPNLDNMKSMYPWLAKWPMLLPCGWVLRGAKSLLYRRGNIKAQFGVYQHGNQEYGEKLKKFYKKYNL